MRNYKRKTQQKPLSEDFFREARDLISKGFSIRKAAKSIGFDESTLRKRLKQGQPAHTLGRFRTVFSAAQEKELVVHIRNLDRRFFGLSLKNLRHLLYSYADMNNIPHRFSKESSMAGRDFARAFMKRNRLSLRIARKTSVARMMGFNRPQLMQYFDNLNEVLRKYQFPLQKIYNMDETGVQTVPNKLPLHVAPTGKKEVGKATAAEQGQTVTVVCAMSATGHYVPPYFIYKRKKVNLQLINHGPIGCGMSVSDKGYKTSTVFLQWLDHFKKYTNPTKEDPILLILDNHVSHVSLPSINAAKSNHIHLLTLPPHSSQKTQPLDRGFFRPFKAYYDEIADNWTASHPGQTISVYNVAELVATAFQRAATIETAVKAFRATGIFPMDRNVFSDVDFMPSEVTEQDENGECEQDELYHVMPEVESNEPHSVDTVAPVIPEQVDPSTPPRAKASTPKLQAENRAPAMDPSTPPTEMTSQSKPVTPEDIIPLPRTSVKRKRTGKGLKSALITSTPYKKRLEAMQETKRREEEEKVNKRKEKALKIKQKKAPVKRILFSSSESELEDSSSEDSEDLTTDSHYDSADDNDLQSEDFALVKVCGKTENHFRYYVAKIVGLVGNMGYDVVFYKRTPKTHLSSSQRWKKHSCGKRKSSKNWGHPLCAVEGLRI